MTKPLDDKYIAHYAGRLSDPMKVRELRAALKQLVDLCDWCGDFQTRDIEPHKLEAIVEDTIDRARRHARIVFAFPHLFTASEMMTAIRFVRQWGWA